MKSRLLNALSLTGVSMLLCAGSATMAVAGDSHHRKHVFSDFARVIHVEPKYRIVTKRTPQRICHGPRLQHQPQRSRHQGNRRHHHHNNTAVFVGGVIGGAIGHEVTRSINGRSHPGGVLAGAAIGAGLAASHQRHQLHHRGGNSSVQRHRQHHDRHHHSHRRQRCTTTEHVQRIRQPDGFLVTYRFRGQSFRTHTDYHPGDRIRVNVSLSTAR